MDDPGRLQALRDRDIFLGLAPILDSDEGSFCARARSALARGDWAAADRLVAFEGGRDEMAFMLLCWDRRGSSYAPKVDLDLGLWLHGLRERVEALQERRAIEKVCEQPPRQASPRRRM